MKMKQKSLTETQTQRAGSTIPDQKIFAPPQTTFTGGGRTAEIESAGDGHYLHLQTQFGEDRCTQFPVIVTNPQTSPARPAVANRQDG